MLYWFVSSCWLHECSDVPTMQFPRFNFILLRQVRFFKRRLHAFFRFLSKLYKYQLFFINFSFWLFYNFIDVVNLIILIILAFFRNFISQKSRHVILHLIISPQIWFICYFNLWKRNICYVLFWKSPNFFKKIEPREYKNFFILLNFF